METRTRRLAAIIAGLALVALPLSACGDDEEGAADTGSQTTTKEQATAQQETVPATVSVSIGDNFYKPEDVKIRVGQSIKWRNDGAIPHTVTSDGDSKVKFDSGNLDPRGIYALKPATRGTLTYYCKIHGKAQAGKITVDR
jgi:plastocyanin